MQNLQLCQHLRNTSKKFKVDIKKDDLERSLKSHLIIARTEKWIICISKDLQSKRKKNSRMKRYSTEWERVFDNYIRASGLIFRQCKELKTCIQSMSKHMN